jgi:hypothetical protein
MRNEGIAAPNETLSGLKAKKVIIRYKVNKKKKMAIKLATQRRVFGILYFTIIIIHACQAVKRLQKKII